MKNIITTLKFAWYWLSLLIVIGACVWIFRTIDWSVLSSLRHTTSWLFLMPLLVLYPLSIFLCTLRWRLFMEVQQKRETSFWQHFRIYWYSSLIGQILPAASRDLVKFGAAQSKLGKKPALPVFTWNDYQG